MGLHGRVLLLTLLGPVNAPWQALVPPLATRSKGEHAECVVWQLWAT